MFAASRNLRVMGRTEILVVSINTKNGFNHLGAPPGRREAVQEEGLNKIPDRIRDNHRGNPIVKVKDRCLEILNI